MWKTVSVMVAQNCTKNRPKTWQPYELVVLFRVDIEFFFFDELISKSNLIR